MRALPAKKRLRKINLIQSKRDSAANAKVASGDAQRFSRKKFFLFNFCKLPNLRALAYTFSLYKSKKKL
jgi:hypothetical protein